MVNEVFHRPNLSFANEDTESEDGDTVTTGSPEISLPKHQAEKTRGPLSQIFIRSFKAVTRIKGTKKNDSKHIEQFLREIAGERLERFSPRQIKSFTGNFSSELGMGGFGSVYKGLMPNGVDVAIKLTGKEYFFQGLPEFMTEVSILSRTYHKNVVSLLGYCVDGDVLALVYEYMANGSLERVLVSNNNGVDWDILESIAIEIAKGIAYLHEECPKVIIHLDVKPSNILLSTKYSPKLADFGLAVQFDGDHKGDGIHASVIKGTLGYIDPEFCLNGHATCKSDVYGFGMVLFDILGRCNLHGNERYHHGIFPRQVWDKFQTGNLDYLKERTGRMSMAALWCIQDRPSMSTVVSILKGDIEVKQPPYAYSDFPELYSHANTGSSFISLRNEGIAEINAVQSGPGYESDTVLFTPTTETNGVEMAT